jgi:hypothetical protein
MERAKQRKTVDIDKGLFLIRYTAAEDELRPPKVRVSTDAKSGKSLTLVLHPDHKEAVLWQPGTGLIVKASEAGQLVIEVVPMDENASAAATVKIEPLSQGKARMRPAPPAAFESALAEGEFRILGHVAGIGDVFVEADEWIAGPSAPSRIEGISIDWPEKPDDIDIRYAVKLARPHAASGRMMDVGEYAGTRGRALPIVGVVLELSGPGASGHQFSAEAIFLGSPTMRVSGQRVVLSGPTGREPLVGFRMRLEEVRGRSQPAPPAAKAGRKTSSRVRVFRSRAKQGHSVAS